MSKALKIAGTIIGVAAAAVAIISTAGVAGAALGSILSFGLGATGLGGIAAVLTLGGSLLAPRPKAPSVSAASADRLFASIDVRTPRKIVFGRTAMATDIRDQEYTDSQGYFHRFLVVASHKVHAISEIWFDDKRVWTVAGGVEGEAVGYLTVTPVLEGNAENAINISARMGSTRRYTGCAYVHLKYRLTGTTKKTDSPYAQNIPSRVTIRGDGAFTYDPRLDSTAGGSGAQRASDQSTWTWSDSASRNPALQSLWYELGWRINGKLAVGKGIPPARLDLASYAASANLCDEAVALAAGGSEPRYRSDGVFSEGDGPSLVRDNLKAAMNGVLDDMDGKIRLTVLSNDLAMPIADFTQNDILDGVRWDQTPALQNTFNVIRGGFTDPSDKSLYQLIDYPEIALASIDGIERVETVNYALVQSPSQAQRLSKQRLQRMEYPGIFTANFQATAWRVQKGDVVRLTFPALGWVNKLFRAIDITVRVDGIVPMVLREEHGSIYAWSASEAAPVTAAAPTTYNSQLGAVVLGIEDAGTTAAWSNLIDDDGHLPDDDADITGTVTGPAQIRVAYDYLGNVLGAPLPRSQPYKLLKGGIDRTTDATWSRTLLSGSASSTMGSAGALSYSALPNASVVRASATLDGKTYSLDVELVRDAQPAPCSGGGGSGGGTGGGTTATDNTLDEINSTTHAVISDELVITVGSAGKATVSLSANFETTAESPFGTHNVYAIAQRWNGSSFVDIDTETFSDAPASVSYDNDAGSWVTGAGHVGLSHEFTGLTAGATEKFRIKARRSSGTRTLYLSGAAAAVGE